LELFSFLLGVVFGSFLNVLIVRLPQNKSLLTRSSCPKCDKLIPWYNNIPIFSFFLLKGKCSNCKKHISIVYPFIEVFTGVITLFLFIKLGLSLEFFLSLIFFYILIVLSFIDFKYKAVPDYLLLILFISSFFVSKYNFFESLKAACLIAGAFVLLNFLVTFYIQNIKSKILKDKELQSQEALGEGDIPVLGSFAVILGIKASFVAIFFAALFAIIPSIYNKYKNKDIEIPFIPFLALGFIIEYFFEITKVIF